MQIAIWDFDWYNKQSFIPNVKCMKLSSYHKQRGDEVFLIKDAHDLSIYYNRIYIAKELKYNEIPPRKLIDDNRTMLIGDGFAMYGAKEPNGIVMACRPDYLLYPTAEKDKYANANFVTFYSGSKLMANVQDYHNTKKHHHLTMVADKWFWKATDEEIISCLKVLKNDKNIAFFEPISLNRLLSNIKIQEKFLELHFAKGTPFKWKNDYSSDNVQPIIDFLLKLKSRTKSDLKFIPIKAELNDTEENNLVRCFKIIGQFKLHKLKCIIINNNHKNNIFEILETWTRYMPQLSFVEFILHDYCKIHGMLWYIILNNAIHWSGKNIDYLLYLLTASSWDNYRRLLFLQWGTNELNSTKINYDYIKKHINLLYKENTDE